MSALTLAYRRMASFLDLPAPESLEALLSLPTRTRHLGERIEQEIVPAVTELCSHATFQNLTLYPLHTLLPDCGSPQRQQIDTLRQELMATAAQTSAYIDTHETWLQQQFEQVAAQRRLQDTNAQDWPYAIQVDLSYLRAGLASVRERCAEEWAAAEDYFAPTHLVWTDAGHGECFLRSEMATSIHEELPVAGNVVARCLLIRADTAARVLRDVTEELEARLIAAGRPDLAPWQPGLAQITGALADLRQLCLYTPEARLAEAAICLLQTWVAFAARTPDLHWLPVEARQSVERIRWRQVLYAGHKPYTLELLKQSLERVEQWWSQQPPPELLLEAKIAAGGLVIVEAERRVYWQGQMIDARWTKCHRPWQLVLALARSRGHVFVGEEDLYGDKVVSRSALAVLKNKLCQMLPTSLGNRIQAVAGEKIRYQLKLGADQIYVQRAE